MSTPSWSSLAAVVRAAATRDGARSRARLALEGVRLCERALAAAWPLEALLCSERFAAGGDPRELALAQALERAGVALVRAPDAEFALLVEGRSFGDAIAIAHAPPSPPPLTDLVERAPRRPSRPALLLGAVDVDDPGNAGALVRTAHALGASAFLAIGRTRALHPKSLRTSMGSFLRLPILEPASLELALDELAAAGARCFAASASPDAGEVVSELQRARTELARPAAVALIVGSEAHGLDAEQVERIGNALRIDMPSGVDSLSVNAAAAILLHELRRAFEA